MGRAPLTLTALLLLAGCGGGGGRSTSTIPAVRSGVTISWAARSRTINAPSSALQATVLINRGSGESTFASVTCVRPDGAAAVAKAYPFDAQLPEGDFTMYVSFNADPLDSYSNVGSISAPIHVDASGTILNRDGTALGDLDATGSPVDHVVVAADQSVKAGETKDLTITAYNVNNGPLELHAGAFFVRLGSGNALRVNSDSSVTGLGAGTAEVIGTVDEVDSPATPVSVVSP